MNKAQERRWPAPAEGGGTAGPAAVAAAAARARLPRVMPHWVSASGRGGAAAPPPPPARPEPDYEVIEFPSDQYVNAKLNPAPRAPVSQHCGLCGAPGARVRCVDCEGRAFCSSCDDMYHRHPKRRAHRRQPLGGAGAAPDDSVRPPLPPKGAGGAQAPPPVPPPRRNKVGGRSDSFSSRGSRTPAPASPAPSGAATPAHAHARRPLPAAPLPPHLQYIGGSERGGWTRPPTATSVASPPASPHPPHLMQQPHDPQAGWQNGGGGGWGGTLDRRRGAGVAGDGALRRAPLASSVFELHRADAYPHPMQQQRFLPAQSMATLNCANCAGCQQQRAAGDWWRYGSNASLDVRQDGFAPPAWVNPWLPPMPVYPHHHHTTGRPASRGPSRTTSRAASPAASVRSRRARPAPRRYREPDDYSDDEDSSGERDRRGARRRDSLRSAPPRLSPPRLSPPQDARRAPYSQQRRESPARRGSDSIREVHASRESLARRESPAPRAPLSPPRRDTWTPPAQLERSGSSEASPSGAEAAPDALDAPPPPVPTARWTCEYCTYVNEAGTRVCEICCKTPTAPPSAAPAAPAPAAPAPAAPAPADRLAADVRLLKISDRASEPTPVKKGEDGYIGIEREQSDAEAGGRYAASLGVKRVKRKSPCEKVSTGCGPSPPREPPPSAAPPAHTAPPAHPAPPAPTSTASTGTSPLPQSTSTQTYESPDEVRQAAAVATATAPVATPAPMARPASSTADESSRSTRRRSARSLRRDARRSSRRSPDRSSRRSPDHTSRSERSHSRHSFSSDRSMGTPVREWSPVEAAAPDDWWREAGPLRSRSNSLMQHARARPAAPARRAPPRRASHLDLYRERDDAPWRRPDRDSFGDPYAYRDQREAAGAEAERAVSLEALAAAAAAARRQSEAARSQGLELVKLLREAEASGYTAEEVHAATQLGGGTEPVRWLRDNWPGMVASVQAVASKLGREAGAGDAVGTLSEREARDALRRHQGSVWQAVTDCVQQRQKKYGELMSRGKFSREEVLTCLTAHHGDLEAAYLDLTRTQLKPILMKIWGPPEGVENDSGNTRAPGPSASTARPTGDTISEDVNLNYMDKLKRFETVLNKDANVHADESVSGNSKYGAGYDPQVSSQAAAAPPGPTREPRPDITNIFGGLKTLLDRAGLPVSDEYLINGLKSMMKISNQVSGTKTSSDNKSKYEELIDTENDFIQAYNALTSSSPLPSIDTPLDLVVSNNMLTDITQGKENTLADSIKNGTHINIINAEGSHAISNTAPANPDHLSDKSHNSNVIPEFDDIHNQSLFIENSSINKVSRIQLQNESAMKLSETRQVTANNREEEPADGRAQHLSDIVNDTHRIIRQMKEEINSDMASYDEDGPNTDSDNESSVTPDPSDPDTYSEENSSSAEDEESSDQTENGRKINVKSKSSNLHGQTSTVKSTSSDENEQFEEALDNSENVSYENNSYEQTNMAALDAIVKSLQEIDTSIIPKDNAVNSSTNLSFYSEETHHENEYNMAKVNVPSDTDINIEEPTKASTSEKFTILTKNTNITVGDSNNESMIVADEPNPTNHNNIQTIFTGENNIVNVSQIETETDVREDYNNNLVPVKTFEEIYESLNSNQTVFINSRQLQSRGRSPTPEVILAEDIQNEIVTNRSGTHVVGLNNNLLQDNETNYMPTNRNDRENIIYVDDEADQSNDSLSDNSNNGNSEGNTLLESYDDKITTIDQSENTLNNIASNSEPTQMSSIPSKPTVISLGEGNEAHLAPIKNIGVTKSNETKSSIPKPKTTNPVNVSQRGEIKQPSKVITSKVPIRRNSLKQSNGASANQKSHFGNIQSGLVRKLQSSLFSKNDNKNPKIPVPINKKSPPKSGLSLVKPMPSKIITIQSDISADSKSKLKPYFQETCLSDDYLTETDDEAGRRSRVAPRAKSEPRASSASADLEPEPLPVTSRLVNGKIVDFTQVPLKGDSPERQVRMLVAEGVVESWQQAEVAVALAARGEAPAAALLAAHDCEDLPTAIAYLRQDCELCAGQAPAYEMIKMLACKHRCCSDCARNYFTVQITERSLFDCVCPFCKLPELAASTQAGEGEDEALEYFGQLEHLLRSVVETEVHELFQRKLRDRALLQDPNFKWCVECSSGFFVHPRQKRLTCPECRSVTCARCRKPWEKQHEGVSCEKFAEWKEANDPESSVAAVQRHLQDNGIDCPKCKFRYSLTRGGCMHFTCSQCKYEFCCGCGKPFTMGARCGLSEYCAKLGLHAHHPRNCLFYLRDKEPHQLQTLLQMNNIEYKTEPAEGEAAGAEGAEGGAGERRPRRCPVALQRETPAGLVDTTCNGDVPPQHAGLCKNHYLEYLSRLARRGMVDPLPILLTDDLETLVRRAALKLPPKPYGSLEGLYRTRLLEIVKEKIPLD